jgi:choline dehydrogenase
LLLSVGRIVGGSGSINAMIWLRGDERDYAAWAEAGGPTWGFAPVLRAFKRIEDYRGGDGGASSRGRSGPIPVGRPTSEHPLTPLFLRAAQEELGVRRIPLNGRPRVDGTGVAEANVEDGRRVGPAQAYLQPVLARPNLTLLAGTRATGLLLAGGRCRGVTTVRNGRRHDFEAAREVVLCAGALLTPKLLLLSGLGPAEDLRKVGIPCRQHLPAVGRNLHDHIAALGLYFATSRELPPLVANGTLTLTYLRTKPPTRAPDVQLWAFSSALFHPVFGPQEAYLVIPTLVKPTSRGRLRLASADPADPPLIDPNYLATAADRSGLGEAVKRALELGNAGALSRWRRGVLRLRDLAPEGLDVFIRQSATSYLHYVGTCAFGRSPGSSVVDARDLRVWGVDGLRVADASVIPEVPCVNTHAPTLIVAEKAAEMIGDTGRSATTAG